MHLKVNLTLLSVLIIFAFFKMPFYNNWMNTNLLNPAFDIVTLSKQTDLEQRKVNRYGASYLLCKQMTDFTRQQKMKDPLILLPPEAFIKEKRIRDVNIPEPMVFYYMTGQKAVWYDSPEVMKANLALVVDPQGKLSLIKINNQQELNNLLAVYRKYKLEL